FLQGHSGVRSTLVNIVQAMLNRGVVPLVPLRGSVGASGDLCPLSHLFATLLGVGKFYVLPETQTRVSVPHREASELPALLGFKAEEMKPTFKEGLALVHGASRDAIAFARGIAEREINAATDNPLFFPEDGEPWDLRFRGNWPPSYRGEQRLAYSAGNFHGQPIAIAADVLSIALAELASISERRTQML